MSSLFNPRAPKKPTILNINSGSLEKSRALDINLSTTLEAALAKHLAEAYAERWKQANKNVI